MNDARTPRFGKTRCALLALALGLFSCDGRKGFAGAGLGASSDDIIEFDLSKGISEKGASTLFGPVPESSYADLLETIRKLDTKDVKGVVVRIGSAHVGLAHAEELGRRFQGLRDQDIPVTCHADDLDNSTLLFTSLACSKVYLTPTGGVDSVGLAFQLLFAKSLLDKLGVGVDFLQVGKYKGAQEPYTRDEPSPEARQSVEEALSNLRSAWIGGIVAGRGAAAEAAVEDGPHTAVKAKALGLVDELGYLDDARKSALGEADEKLVPRVVFGGSRTQKDGDFGEVMRALAGADGLGSSHVAVVRAVGAITMEPSGGLTGGGDGITESQLGKTITKLTEADDVKAVVLRIESPGGSALASDLLWHKLMLLREKKPLVISVGSMAASGGYYLSCAGTRIFAEKTSILGSIGVVGGKFSVGETLSSVGVNVVTIPAAPDPVKARRAGYLSPFDRWDDPTREKVREGMESIYGTFIDRIAEGRKLDHAVVSQGAEGRIFGGARALELQLIDEIGGLEEAIQFALTESGLGEKGLVRIRGEAAPFAELLGGDPDAQSRVAEQAERSLDPIAKLTANLPEPLKVWVDATAPMTKGETMLFVTPFALSIQ